MNITKIKTLKRDIGFLKNNILNGKVVSDESAINQIEQLESQIDNILFAEQEEIKKKMASLKFKK